eukprot:6459048-Amphidinium_carterae.2
MDGILRRVTMDPQTVARARAVIARNVAKARMDPGLPSRGNTLFLLGGSGFQVGLDLDSVLGATDLNHHRGLWRLGPSSQQPRRRLTVGVK